MDKIFGNKLIAAYMGGIPYGDGSGHFLMPTQFKSAIVGATYLHSVNSFMYHLSWDQLMPVWDKLRKEPAISGIFGMMEQSERKGKIAHGLALASLEATWLAIVEMIIWLTKIKSRNE